ncbi:DsbE family thiol:disulfide interchange protein [Tianweitania sp. BSSL-BM11]|uniref:DsbE family thiol:disulfide interchange protein n=1 Tax=Tianweitania aestuarii TaxID=2814886 RepID=A0ABS5RZ20_9HYPH|nr:DsbE family thiol:disulfide interchange protein [Tianweitania aestuarii]MBS9722276.1 DsbE family thiol:disulfide interchange protein [Tianweitania aestuarii]
MNAPSDKTAAPNRRGRFGLYLLPLLFFVVMAGFFLAQLLSGRDESVIPSVLIDAPAPQTDLPALAGMDVPGLRSQDFAGKITLVNVFASWCAPCREEHPTLIQLAKDKRFSLVGLNYKDKEDNARGFLRELGNPYAAIGVDASGRKGIDWGVYGVPETFVVGRDGHLAYKFVGPLTPDAVSTRLMPAIEAAMAKTAAQ